MILITGITGLVGSYVARNLIDNGYAVRGLVRNTPPTKLLDQKYIDQIEWIEGDILDISSLYHGLNKVEAVVHCAAIISFVPANQSAMFNTNVVGTANVVNASLELEIPKFIHVSSVAALGRKEGVVEIDENAKWEESPRNSGYASSKYLAELEVWRGAEEGLNVSIVNPSIILGAGDTAQGSTKLFDYVAKERKFYTDGNINYVDVRDVAAAITTLVREDQFNERFILNGGTTTFLGFFQKIGLQMNKKAPNIKANKILLEIAWRLAAIYALFSQKEPILTKETAQMTKANYRYNSRKSKAVLGLAYHELEDTIGHVCNELLRNK